MSRVVFVANIPWNSGEEELTDIFRLVGEVVDFRLSYDRDTGEFKGYGFCEFADHETATSAVRNLNHCEVRGRPLHVGLAEPDPTVEGKVTVCGAMSADRPEIHERWGVSGGNGGGSGGDLKSFLAALPPGIEVPPGSSAENEITKTLAAMSSSELMEVLVQTKEFVMVHPEHARALFVANPQLAYALFQAMFLNNIVDPGILQKMKHSAMGAAPPEPPKYQSKYQSLPSIYPPPQVNYAPPQTNYSQQLPQQSYSLPAQPQAFSNELPPGLQPRSLPSLPPPPSLPSASAYAVEVPQAASYRPPSVRPPPQPQIQPRLTSPQSENERNMLLQVLSLPPERVNAMSEDQRAAVLALRAQFSNLVSIGIASGKPPR